MGAVQFGLQSRDFPFELFGIYFPSLLRKYLVSYETQQKECAYMLTDPRVTRPFNWTMAALLVASIAPTLFE